MSRSSRYSLLLFGLAMFGLAVVASASERRTYWGVSIAEVASTKHTHIAVCGRVALSRVEDDGDVHLRLEDGRGAFVVAEIVPAIPLPRPKVGAFVRVAGVSRYDKQHGWPEVHPVEALSLVSGCSR